MKHNIILPVCLLFLAGILPAQPAVDLGIFNNPANSNKLEIRIKTMENFNPGYLSGLVFTVRHSSIYGIDLAIQGGPPFFLSPGGEGTSVDGFKYYSFQFGGPVYLVNWTAGTEYVAAVIDIINEGGSGVGTFELVTGIDWTIENNSNFFVELNGSNRRNVFYSPSTAAALPVELLSFNAKPRSNGSVALDWESASEKELAYYEVEHSLDGQQFAALGKEAARGGENVATQYAYTHKTPLAGSNYYRLRMVDNNGAFEYSPIRTVLLDREDADFTLLPSPTSGPFALTSRRLEKYPEGLMYQLTDNLGRLIRTDKITGERTGFDLSNEPSGAYYLNILSDRARIVQFPVLLTK